MNHQTSSLMKIISLYVLFYISSPLIILHDPPSADPRGKSDISLSFYRWEKKPEVQDYKLPSNISGKWQGKEHYSNNLDSEYIFSLHTIFPLTWECFLKVYDPHPCSKHLLLHNNVFSDLKSSVKSGNLTVCLNNLKSNRWYKFSNMHLYVKSSLLAHSTKISWRHLKDFHVELPPNYHLYKSLFERKKSVAFIII